MATQLGNIQPHSNKKYWPPQTLSWREATQMEFSSVHTGLSSHAVASHSSFWHSGLSTHHGKNTKSQSSIKCLWKYFQIQTTITARNHLLEICIIPAFWACRSIKPANCFQILLPTRTQPESSERSLCERWMAEEKELFFSGGKLLQVWSSQRTREVFAKVVKTIGSTPLKFCFSRFLTLNLLPTVIT